MKKTNRIYSERPNVRERITNRMKHNPPDSEWLQPPQGPGLGTGFTRLIVDYPADARGA